MKIGIIIVFRNSQDDIDVNFMINRSNEANNLELCLVNNNSKDSTYEMLKEIKAACKNVSVVNIKRMKSESSAVKAGARYMFNRLDLQHIGYLSANYLKTNNNGLDVLIKVISDNHYEIIEYNVEVRKKREIKQTLFQNLFSIIEYLKNINQSKQFVCFQ